MRTRVVKISNVSEGIKQRMPTKPILLVLDDGDHREQLEALAGSRIWFSPGSFIIFTEHFIGFSDQVVDSLQGHPLALKVLSRFLYEKSINVWEGELDELRTYPDVEIQQKLRPSFDGLDFNRKRIFLVIAVSFIGENKDFVASVLGKENSFAYADMEVLVNKSLITISRDDNSLQMHDLIRSMARCIT
ncbi:disease resistance-like protein DSC1 [Cynara cardunculus var. scolymus]|uniref:disease resistance-like protein DSC1 n=1 Tax=Cynara cardunculus var. scolymus TaxID=59895 RepID=UPI000D630366|nr:disease resistance-like protein DSC1 [Cynara cardunculus var. scolymus]